MTQFELYVDSAPFSILNASVLSLPSYESSLTVDIGGYSRGVVKGSGYNKAANTFTFKYIINSWDYNIIEDIQAQIAAYFTWNRRRTYEVRKLYNGQWYGMRLTAPKYKMQDIENLRRNEITVTLTAIDNYWKALQESSAPFVPSSSETVALNFDSIIEVPIRFEAQLEVPAQDTAVPFYMVFGEYGGKYMLINTEIPPGYAGNNLLSFDNNGGRVADFDISSKMFGSLPLVSGNMIPQFEANLYVSDINLYYTPGGY